MRGEACLVFIALLAAGCASPSEPLQPAATPPGTDAGATVGNATAPTGAAGNATNASTPRVTDFVWTGRTPLEACIPTVVNGCTSPASVGAENVYLFEEVPPTAVSLDLTWSPVTPASEQLVFSLRLVSSCGTGATCSQGVAEATGPSPLHIEMDGIVVGEEERLGLSVRATGLPSPLFGYASTPQAFGVIGNLTFAS